MMKKVVSIIILLFLVCLSYTVNATEPPTEENPTVNLTFETVTSENSVTVTISAGDFEGVEADSVMSASMTLNYDEANIESVEGNSYNNWRISITEETKTVLLETDNANPNTEIAEITFNFRQDITEITTGTLSISDFNISDGILLDEVYPEYSVPYTIQPSEEDNNDTTNDPTNNTTNETVNEVDEGDNIIVNAPENVETNNTIAVITNNTIDNTIVPDSKLPQTGINIAIMILIAVIVIMAVIKLIKYKDIEIK